MGRKSITGGVTPAGPARVQFDFVIDGYAFVLRSPGRPPRQISSAPVSTSPTSKLKSEPAHSASRRPFLTTCQGEGVEIDSAALTNSGDGWLQQFAGLIRKCLSGNQDRNHPLMSLGSVTKPIVIRFNIDQNLTLNASPFNCEFILADTGSS
jgi:hypothetical protein